MSDGFAYIDILFFAMVAAFIALRLRSVLGRRTGHERRRTGGLGRTRSNGAADNVVALPDRSAAVAAEEADPAIVGLADEGVKTALTQIRLADHGFDLSQFLAGARAAFEMIVEAFAAGDKGVLRPLLANDVFADFAAAIDERSATGQALDTHLVGIRSTDPVGAELRDSSARVAVRFESEQVNVLRDAQGEIIEGDPNTAEEVIDIWTFERDTANQDPNWVLVETRTPS